MRASTVYAHKIDKCKHSGSSSSSSVKNIFSPYDERRGTDSDEYKCINSEHKLPKGTAAYLIIYEGQHCKWEFTTGPCTLKGKKWDSLISHKTRCFHTSMRA